MERKSWQSVGVPVGVFGLGTSIMGASASAAVLVNHGFAPGALVLAVCMTVGISLGLLAQVAITNLLALVNQKLADRLRERIVPRVAVGVRDDAIVLRVSYAEQFSLEAEMSHDGAMQLARSVISAAIELEPDTEHWIELQ